MWCQPDGEDGPCQRCGRRVTPKGSRQRCVTEADRAKTIHKMMHGHRIKVPSPRIGDKVGAALAAVGITEDRVKKLFRVKDCGCSDRKKSLNDVSEELAFRTEVVLNRALDFFLGDMVSEEAERMARKLTERLDRRQESRQP